MFMSWGREMSSPPEDSLSWRVLVDEALPGARNMARDHALAMESRPGAGTVRFYRWAPATLSLGRNEPVTVGYRELLRNRPELGVVRRPTGGRAVIHDRELTYSVVLPARALGGPRRAYRRINQGLVAGLRTLGVDARAASGRSLPPDAGPCFLEPADGEVVVASRKVVGSAQARIGKTLLQHGSVLLVADQSALFARSQGVGQTVQELPRGMVHRNGERGNGKHGNTLANPPRSITLSEVLGEVPSWTRLVEALSAGLARSLGGSWTRAKMTRREETLAAEYETRYGSREWTWRR